MALDTADLGHGVSCSGRDLHALPGRRTARARRDFQMVFQDPYGSLDPRQTVARIVAEPLDALGRGDRAEQRERAAELLPPVGLRAPTWTNTRTNSPAASASASRSRAR